jgi:sulfatase modifying factor 1
MRERTLAGAFLQARRSHRVSQALDHPLILGAPPAWASAWGDDVYGVWAAFEVDGVSQKMRWIPPGGFRMGSPESERGRGSDERLHDVRLTHGYWMADTACTQGLWQAVMGSNPSRFSTSPRKPVEQVSWDDVQGFLTALNARVDDLAVRLPMEAEWEYACRAGTDTPFWFGAKGTAKDYNVESSRTVEVASLPANPWGLYGAHGNVWEWCQDWYDEYRTTQEEDARGRYTGIARVLRGGSWRSEARFGRSANRDSGHPNRRGDYVGFRLARGQED